MELTSTLESERHASKDIGQKLSEKTMELAETQQMVSIQLLYIYLAQNWSHAAMPHWIVKE